MDEKIRRGGVDFAMETLRRALHEKRLVPMILVAFDPDHPNRITLMPAGPGLDPQDVRQRIVELGKDLGEDNFDSCEELDV